MGWMSEYKIYTPQEIGEMDDDALRVATCTARNDSINYPRKALKRLGSYDIYLDLALQENWVRLYRECRIRGVSVYGDS